MLAYKSPMGTRERIVRVTGRKARGSGKKQMLAYKDQRAKETEL